MHEQAEAVFRYGDEGDLFYIILSGSVRAICVIGSHIRVIGSLIRVIGSLIRDIRRPSARRLFTAAAGYIAPVAARPPAGIAYVFDRQWIASEGQSAMRCDAHRRALGGVCR